MKRNCWSRIQVWLVLSMKKKFVRFSHFLMEKGFYSQSHSKLSKSVAIVKASIRQTDKSVYMVTLHIEICKILSLGWPLWITTLYFFCDLTSSFIPYTRPTEATPFLLHPNFEMNHSDYGRKSIRIRPNFGQMSWVQSYFWILLI